MRQQCGNCGRPFALTFDRCPACGTPAGSKGHSSLPKALPRKDEPELAPSSATEVQAPPLELDLEAPPAPKNPSSIPDLDLSGLALRHPEPPLDLEPAPAQPFAASAPAAEERPSEELPVERNETPEPSTATGQAAWEQAARAQRAEIPQPTPGPVAAGAFGALLAAQRPVPPVDGQSVGVLFARIITWIGVACVVLGFLPIGCWRVFFGFEKTEVKDLSSASAGKRIELVDGVADWNDAVIVDPDSPTELAEAGELKQRSASLKGKLVAVTAAPLGGYMYKQYRIDANGQREEIPGVTRVYMPLTLDNSVWVVSQLVHASSFEDPEVKTQLAQLRHTGVVQLLSENVTLNDIRNPENISRAPSIRTHVPDDALAIVSVQTGSEAKKYSVARIAGTQGRYVAVTTAAQPGADESLFGELHTCPSKTCQSFAATLPVEPAAVLLLSHSRGFPWTAEVALFILLGIGCAVGGVALRRKLSD